MLRYSFKTRGQNAIIAIFSIMLYSSTMRGKNVPQERTSVEGRQDRPDGFFQKIYSIAGVVRSAISGIISSDKGRYEQLDEQKLREIIAKVKTDKQMSGSKRALLLKNLYDQLEVPNNQYSVYQTSGNFSFRYSGLQHFNPKLRSRYRSGFFSLADATGKSAIVDFANDQFGGGVICPDGFVQEEKLLMETNLIPKAGMYRGLTADPLYMRALRTHAFVGPGEQMYGNRALREANITQQNVGEYISQTSSPTKVNIIAMAAIDMSGNKWREYRPDNYRRMFETALKGFRSHSNAGGEVVHTGAWGAGVFGNSENVTCVLQILAAQAAGKSYEAVFDSLCRYMQKRHENAEFWKPKQ